MGRILRRPTFFAVTALTLKTVLGEFSIEILGSARVYPAVLINNGYEFTHPTLDAALQTLVEGA
jgi:NAD dependent epimerase/dehydratase family enzyme